MNEAEFKARMAGLAHRYLDHTVTEVEGLRALIQRAAANDSDGAHAIELLAHRIRGSAATLGFGAISDAAYQIELLAGDAKQKTYSDWETMKSRLIAGERVLCSIVDAVRTEYRSATQCA